VQDLDRIQARMELLARFRRAVLAYCRPPVRRGLTRQGEEAEDERREEESREINRTLIAAKQAVRDAVGSSQMQTQDPLNIGGQISMPFDPFDNFLDDPIGHGVFRVVVDQVDQAIGVYEQLKLQTGLVRLPSTETIDIESAITRALRPSFGDVEPTGEIEVQDHVATILRSLGVEFTRDQETAPVGPRAFKPDFVVDSLKLAIEVKFGRGRHSASEIQEELTSDNRRVSDEVEAPARGHLRLRGDVGS
jgi:hypothetical protein